MHIPDGFLSPKLYVPSYAAASALWAYGLSRARRALNEDTLPYIGVLSALSFVLMTFSLPLPGGSSVHATGIPLLAILFGVWTSFLCITVVLILQTLIIGEGGITALAVNALCMGFFGALTARAVYIGLRRWKIPSRHGALSNEKPALFLAAFFSILVQAVLTATALGIQPLMASDDQGRPLFFPFGLETTLPAVLLPHLWIALAEGILTVFVVELISRRRHTPFLLPRRKTPDEPDDREALDTATDSEKDAP